MANRVQNAKNEAEPLRGKKEKICSPGWRGFAMLPTAALAMLKGAAFPIGKHFSLSFSLRAFTSISR